MEEYEYISTLGEGAYGYVWKCQERSTGRIVAIKGFKQAHEEPEIMRLAVREVRVLQTLHHPAVIQLIEAFKSKSGRVYMVFPYVGRSAYQELDRHPEGLPPHALKLLVWQLLQALAYLHRRKVIHRDIKPANILLSEGGDVKLCDFGFARYVRCGPHEVQRLSSYVVTRWYRAPEVLVSDLYGPAADIWSLACTVAELATGVPLFPGKSTVDQLWRIMRCFGPLPPRLAARVLEDTRLTGVKVPPPGRTLRERLPGCEPGLLRLVEACLATDPNLRPTAEELLQLPYFWVVPRLLAGTPLESVYDNMLQEPGGGGVCSNGGTKGSAAAAAAAGKGPFASKREMLPVRSVGKDARPGGDRPGPPPPLVLPPPGRTASSTVAPQRSGTSGGGGALHSTIPSFMPPTPDMWAPEQRPGQQCTAAPSTTFSSTTPAAAESDDVAGSSNTSLLPMSPTDIGSPEHLDCASSSCSSDERDEDEDENEEGDASVYDSGCSYTTRASSGAECAARPVRHVQLVADSPAHRQPRRRRLKQQSPPPPYSEHGALPGRQHQQQLPLQQSRIQHHLQQQIQQKQQQLSTEQPLSQPQLQQQQQQQEFQQQLTHPPQRPQRSSHRRPAHREQPVQMQATGEVAARGGGGVVSSIAQPPPPPSQGRATDPVAPVSGGAVTCQGTACTTVSNTSVGSEAPAAYAVPGLVLGAANQPSVRMAAAADGGGNAGRRTTDNSSGTQPHGTEIGLGGSGMEASGTEPGAEMIFQVHTEAGASRGGGAGGDVPGGRTAGGATLLSTAVSAVSLAQLLDLSGPLEASARLANMDGANGDGVNIASSTIIIACAAGNGPAATPTMMTAGSTTLTAARGVASGRGGSDGNELSLWPQSTELLLLPHPSPPPPQSLPHQQGLVRVLTPERPLPPPPPSAAATPFTNTDTNTPPAISLSARSDSLLSAQGGVARRTAQHMQAVPPPLPQPPATATSRTHLAGGATDTSPPMDVTITPARFLGDSVSGNRSTSFVAWPQSGIFLRASGVVTALDTMAETSEHIDPASSGVRPGSTAGDSSTPGAASRSMRVSSVSRTALGTSLPGCRSAMLSSWGGDAGPGVVSDRSPSYLLSTGMPSIAGLSNVPSGHMASCDTVAFAQLCVASPSAVVTAGPPAPNPRGGGGTAAAPRIQQDGAVPGISGITQGGSSYGYGYDRAMHLSVGGSPSYSSYMLKAGGSCSGYSEAAPPLCTTPDGTVAAKTRSSAAAYGTAGDDNQAAAGAFAATTNPSVGRGGAAVAGSSAGFHSYENHPHVLSSADTLPPSALEASRTAAALAAPAQAPAVAAVRSFHKNSVIARESPTQMVASRRVGASYTGMPYAPMSSLPEVDIPITAAVAASVAPEASCSSACFRSGSGAVPSAAAITAASVSVGGAIGDEWVLALETGDQLADPGALANSGPFGSSLVGVAPRVSARSTSRNLLLGGNNSSKVQPIPAMVCRSRSRSRFGSTPQVAGSGSFAVASVSVVAANGVGGGIIVGADGGASPLSGNVRCTADGAPGAGSGASGGAPASELQRKQSSLWAVASSSLRSPPSVGNGAGSNSAAVAAIGDVYDNACTTSPSGVVLLGTRRLTQGEDGEGGSLGAGWSSAAGAVLGGEGCTAKKKGGLSKLLRAMKKALSFK